MSVYSEACSCQWCANLDAKPCVIIEYLEQRIAALEGRVAALDGALDGGDNQSDYWDGTPPLGGDSFDGR